MEDVLINLVSDFIYDAFQPGIGNVLFLATVAIMFSVVEFWLIEKLSDYVLNNLLLGQGVTDEREQSPPPTPKNKDRPKSKWRKRKKKTALRHCKAKSRKKC